MTPARKKSRTQTNIRLTDLARRLLERLADLRGISQADTVEVLIREEAQRRGLWDGRTAKVL